MKKLIGIFFIIALLSSCSSTKKTVTVENNLQQAYDANQYDKVLSKYKQLSTIAESKGEVISPSYLLIAAKSAYYLEDYQTAAQLFSNVDNKEKDQETIYMEAMTYQKFARPLMEYKFLKENITQLKSHKNYQKFLQKLYMLEIEFSEYEDAYQLWSQIEETTDEALMSGQLKVLEELEKSKEALALSNKLLEKNSAHEAALFYTGKHYFNRAEKLYQSEMTKYNRDPNYTTYAYLKRELKKASADFRLARDRFEKLYEISPENKTYISYLKNCYVRLEMKTEAAKMDRLLK